MMVEMEILLLLEGLCDNFLGGFLSVFIFFIFFYVKEIMWYPKLIVLPYLLY